MQSRHGDPAAGAPVAEMLRGLLPQVRGRSPLYERLLAGFAGAAERGFDGGALGRLLDTGLPDRQAEARLLVLAALHHAALEDPALAHAAWFPTAVGDRARPADDGAPAALSLAWIVEHEAEVATFLAGRHVQTNEIGRCAALLPGMLRAGGFGLPLRLLELGTSAGLHLRLDRYQVRFAGGPRWGPTGGPQLDSRAEGVVPTSLAPPSLEVTERRGVDLAPLDVTDPDDLRLLSSFVWPDERDSHARLAEAVEVARATPARIDRGDLVTWARTMAAPQPATTTVLFHSQVRHLLDATAVAELGDVVERALRSAGPDSPFVYVSFEPPRGVPDDGSNWPELTVAVADGSGPPHWATVLSADWHGRWVRWL